MAIVAGIVCVAIGRWSTRHTAGMRGDTFGAAAELTDTLALAVALAAS
jgi:cobalamin synthase